MSVYVGASWRFFHSAENSQDQSNRNNKAYVFPLLALTLAQITPLAMFLLLIL